MKSVINDNTPMKMDESCSKIYGKSTNSLAKPLERVTFQEVLLVAMQNIQPVGGIVLIFLKTKCILK